MLSDLASTLPDLAPRLQAVKDRLRDLLAVVRAHVYAPAFDYSFSLKRVAPALVPGFDYSDLEEIADGGAASSAYPRLIDGAMPEADALRLRRALLAYCHRDTLALVKIHQALQAHAVAAEDHRHAEADRCTSIP